MGATANKEVKALDRARVLGRAFGSFGEFVTFGEKAATCEKVEYFSVSQDTSDPDWYGGCATYADAVKLARHGGDAARETKVRVLSEKIGAMLANRPLMQSLSTGTAWGEEGDYCDVSRYAEGDPECFIYERGEERPAKSVTIICDAWYHQGVSQQSITAAGATVAAVVDALEGVGIRCELWVSYAADANGTGYDGCSPMARLKGCDEPFDIGVVTFALTHAASMRRMFFAYLEAENADNSRVNTAFSGYGRFLHDANKAASLARTVAEDAGIWENTFYIGASDFKDRSDEARAVEFAEQIIDNIALRGAHSVDGEAW